MNELLFESSIRALIVAVFAGGMLTLFRVRDAGFRHACWKLVLVAMLVMPLLVWMLPALELPILAAPEIAPVRSPLPPTLYTGTPSETVQAVAVPAPESRSLTLIPLYLAVSLMLMVRIGFGYILGLRLVRSATPIDVTTLPSTQPRVRYLSTPNVSVPMTFGLPRAAVLLPEDFHNWDVGKLTAVLNHEHAHISRWDFTTTLVASLTKSMYWANPLSWWLEWRLATLAERAADDLAAGSDRAHYAEVLLGLARDMGPQRVRGVRALAVTEPRGLATRINQLLDTRYSKMLQPKPTTVFIAALSGVALITAISMTDITHAVPAPTLEVERQAPLPPAPPLAQRLSASGQSVPVPPAPPPQSPPSGIPSPPTPPPPPAPPARDDFDFEFDEEFNFDTEFDFDFDLDPEDYEDFEFAYEERLEGLDLAQLGELESEYRDTARREALEALEAMRAQLDRLAVEDILRLQEQGERTRENLQTLTEEKFKVIQEQVERARENVERLDSGQIARLQDNVERLNELRSREAVTSVRNAQPRALELSRRAQDRTRQRSNRDRSIRDREGTVGVYVDGEPGVIPARIVGRREEPQCSDQARLDEVESTISIQGVVRRNGDFEVQRIMVDGDSSDEVLGETMAAVRNWDFEPGTRDGEPVDVFYNIEVDFDCQ